MKIFCLVLLLSLSGCGISKIHCEIVTDEEMIERVLLEVLKEIK